MFLNLSILLLTSTLSLLTSAAPTTLDSTLAISKRIAQRQDDPNVEITALILPDGTRKLAFWENGILEGYLIESSNTSAPFIATDAFGAPIDPSEFLEAEEQDGEQDGSEWGAAPADVEARGIISTLARLTVKFAGIFKKWDKRAWDFVYCAGVKPVYNLQHYGEGAVEV
ncbi:hypothetical protein H2199_004453 [Coniosporium tulheliwenetii]|uniref:Uncharacterized protein n=1 Tax=Coniosporium tulheliwenetii TaxID=3383036 RepID=A0ACC2Z5W7_9PEZI|nr:hypothetical protein H2199_004453 [Cladosporium sp. JES 115]